MAVTKVRFESATTILIVNLPVRENKENKCVKINEQVNKLRTYMILKCKYCAKFYKKHRMKVKISELNVVFNDCHSDLSSFFFEKC
jgi:hypothetical protein